jgi:hypothetical protein
VLMQSINEVFRWSWGMLRRAQTSTFIMKTKLILLPLILVSLSLSSYVSLALGARESFGHKPSVGERVGAGAIDLVTLPVQLPVLIKMQMPD